MVEDLPAATASGTPVIMNGFLISVTIVDGGNGYTNPPLVRIIGGGGAGAVAVAVVSNGVVTGINVMNTGSGYFGSPIVVISPPFIDQPLATDMTLRSLLTSTNLTLGTGYQLQALQSAVWTDIDSAFTAGSSIYSSYCCYGAPNAFRLATTPTPGQAFATAQVTNGFIVGVTVTAGGSGYVTNPAVIFVASEGSNASARSSITGGSVSGISIITPGNGYTNGVHVQIEPPPAVAVFPEVMPVIRVVFSRLSPYDNYEVESAGNLSDEWNPNGELVVPTAISNAFYIPITNSQGFYRVTYSSSSNQAPDIVPPANISTFTAIGGNAQVDLRWSNPTDPDFAGVKIQRRTGGYPSSTTDGTTIYTSNGTNTADTGLTNGTAYFYRAFAYDGVTNYASGATATATPVLDQPPSPTSYTLLHSFSGNSAINGESPEGSLTISGSTLYGMTYGGGAVQSTQQFGTIFKVNTDGTGFAILHSFTATPSDGSHPYGSLTLSGSTLYGMTELGGEAGYGVIFKINTDGSGFSLLHSFDYNDRSDGCYPHGSLILSDSTLYGMTRSGGVDYWGTIFKINTNGSGFGLLHSFAGGTSDGSGPRGSLAISGSTLYGMAVGGGTNGKGTIFRINTDGSAYGNLHSFAGGASDGHNPHDSLTILGSTLYGMTIYGGSESGGTIFRINMDGSEFGLLHSFASSSWSASNGHYPRGSLIAYGATLYGMTDGGGASGKGVVFRINADGSSFTLLYPFLGGVGNSGGPYGSLTLSNSTLYGMTRGGGANVGGTIFSLR
jgi:uncharacterized repeat protein (TIGR03803 family)